jgi:MFS family permease
MLAAARSYNPFRVLVTHRNFRIFWIGQTLSLIGTWMQSMASGWLALELSNSAFVVGLVATAGSLPVLLLSLPAGVLVDRYSKLRLVTAAQSLLLLEAAILWGLTVSGHITIPWLLALSTFAGAVNAVEIPARQSMMIDLVGRDDLRDAIALNSSGFNLARIFGPGVGAAVIAKLGIAWCFGINALSYLTVLVSLTLISLPPWLPVRPTTSPLRGILEGIEYMRSTRSVAALMLTVTVYSICGVPYITLMPVVAREQLSMGPGGFGVMLSCVGIGGLAGALALAGPGSSLPRGRTLAAASHAFAVILLIFSTVRTPGVAYVLLLLAGFTMIVNNASANGLLQSLVPDALRGRMMATYSLIVVGLSQVVGAFVAGAVARLVGVDWAIAAGAAIMLAYAIYAFRPSRELVHL